MRKILELLEAPGKFHCLLIALFFMINSANAIYLTWIVPSSAWYISALQHNKNLITFVVVFLPILFGATLFIGILQRSLQLVKIGLFSATSYCILLMTFNIMGNGLRGTPWVPFLFFAILSGYWYLRYQLVDNSSDGL